MKVLFVVTFLIALCNADNVSEEEFKKWKMKFDKSYTSVEEENKHKENWFDNLKLVRDHNRLADQGIKSYRLDMNYFADMTGALEGQTYKKTGKLVPLSKQQLVDCSTKNSGCNGGLMNLAFEYVKENKGINTEESYPYEAKNGSCRYNPNTVGATCDGYMDINSGDEYALKEAVATIGPISVAIDASNKSFKLYASGIYDEPYCSSSKLNHGVLVVGYGTDDGKDYWLVKNSWGLNWGDKGYIKMYRNKDNQCGIASQASYPLVYNKTQRVHCEACSVIFILGCLLLGFFY
ncbi:cathepsin L-like isoform X3 [Tachysurus vachellii]|uniref:cathepsin L-like isoform X3 n=1 Tax=Tachysurus vachellii TaxID=175792 RepID=UPI00296A9708|nr:cathepsin L-like isoform X3 [Tachysurus vachellii]